jgi:adenosylhomocysteine nucleosidase
MFESFLARTLERIIDRTVSPSRDEDARRVNGMPAAPEPRILILCPLAREWSFLVSTFEASLHVERLHDLKIDAAYIPDWRVLVGPGGHGKTQFAVQAQYLIGRFSSVELVICAGAAGSLAPELSVGDVLVGTETVEHDYRQLFATRPLPRFPGHGPSIDALRRLAHGISGFHVAFDVIASGDEDVVTSERAKAIRDQTGAACVAWEGSGAARAALFNGIGSLEIRAVTDAADKEAPQRFEANLPIAMANLASLLRLWLEQGRNHSQTY